VLLAGCGRSGAGLAARVGDDRIPTSALTARVERALADRAYAQSHSPADIQRTWVRRLIQDRLVREAARRLKVSVTSQDIDKAYADYVTRFEGEQALLRAAASDGIGAADVRSEIARATLQDKVADKLVADVTVTDAQLRETYAKNLKDYDKAHIAHINVADQRKAADAASRARAPGADFAALAKQFSEDVRTQATGGDLGIVGNGEGKFAKVVEDAVFKAKTGDVLGPIKSGTTYEIVKVVERRTTTFEQAREDVRRRIIGDARVNRVSKYLQDLAHELGLSVNPRFGRWDFQQGTVVASGDDLSSPAPSPGDLQPTGP
jgi:parvulin-like peptidyl-prolyl isomerase